MNGKQEYVCLVETPILIYAICLQNLHSNTSYQYPQINYFLNICYIEWILFMSKVKYKWIIMFVFVQLILVSIG